METLRNLKYVCPKCGSRQYEIDEFRAVGSMFTKLFNIQTKRFTTVSCKRCRYTEIYKTTQKKFANVIDFFIG